MYTENNLHTSSGVIHYAQGPYHGLPLVLLHGVLRGWQDWSVLLPSLSCRSQVYALDFRGHGQSARTPGQYRVTDYIVDAQEFIEMMCPTPPVVIGHSLGAMVALAVAANSKIPVRGIVLEDPPFETMGGRIVQSSFLELFQGMQKVIHSKRDVVGIMRGLAGIQVTPPGAKKPKRLGELRDPTSLRFSAKCLSRVDPGVLEPIVRAEWLHGFDLMDLVANVRCPVLLLQADPTAGGMLTDQDADLMETALSDCCRVRMPGASHLVHWMQTEAMMRLVTGFLESI